MNATRGIGGKTGRLRTAAYTFVPSCADDTAQNWHGGGSHDLADLDLSASTPIDAAPEVCEVRILGVPYAPSADPQEYVVHLTIRPDEAGAASPRVSARVVPADAGNVAPRRRVLDLPSVLPDYPVQSFAPAAPSSPYVSDFCGSEGEVVADVPFSDYSDGCESNSTFEHDPEFVSYEEMLGSEHIDAHERLMSGFQEADRVRRRRSRRLRVTLVSAFAMLGFCLCLTGLTGVLVDDGLPIGGTEASTSSQAADQEQQANSTGAADDAGKTAQGASDANDPTASDSSTASQPSTKAGEVTYTYTTESAEGGQVSVTEVVTFDAEGYAETSRMSLSFENEEAAVAFLTRIERDYGGAYLSGSVSAASVEVHIDVSESRMTKSAYRRALTASAHDVAISGAMHSDGSSSQISE